ncbi:hypothetical protein [Paracidobacterium acidisoli]|uniref:Uncharacterized protein n=1 Tax=Paracidobacterium acidisoli TaxID=2303751 RepID=A0A372IRE1_9BACT|nr:hypothetical protein [Paracidobacterium acidisoli]MBT9330209.1 hypothetical protein [Paracidobacterium acidisoli]
MSGSISAVPPALVEGFAAVFNDFVNEVAAAVAEAMQKNAAADSWPLRAWRNKVLPLLQKHNKDIQESAAAFQSGQSKSILTWAEQERGLAKDLDGFPLDFAGPEHAQKLDFLETRIVTVAFQICAAAGIP